jgi:hypothetical protein
MNNNQTRSSLNMVLREYYLDWVNNWISVEAFAGYHDLSVIQASGIIRIGRKLHESSCEIMRQDPTGIDLTDKE